MPRERTTAGCCHRTYFFVCALAILLLFGSDASAARAAFGFEAVTSTFTAEGAAGSQLAGSHPESWSTRLVFNEAVPGYPDGSLKDLHIVLPPGLVGAPALLPECTRGDYLADDCPASTAVGGLGVQIADPAIPVEAPLYLLESPPGQAAQLGFHAYGVPVTIDLSISSRPPYNVIASITNASQAGELLAVDLTLEGSPNGNAFLTLPRSCSDSLATAVSAFSWQAPAIPVSANAPAPQAVSGCGDLAYSPTLKARPTSSQADSPSGLDVSLDTRDEGGIALPNGRADADTARAVLELPVGMTVNPPVADGLAACSPAQLAAETPDGVPGEGCPQASKLGTAEVQTPLFAERLAGAIYLAEPDDHATAAPGAENPFDSLLALHLVIADAERGVLLALPIEVAADPDSGRLTAILERIPQLPISRLALHFNSGPHAPLTTPGSCASQTIAYTLTPSSGNSPLHGGDTFTASGNCVSRFAPTLVAGTLNPLAGRSSPFVLNLSQTSGEESLSRFSLTLPPGLSADFGAVPLCPEALAAAGRCPADSSIGSARIAAGTGPAPLWVPGGGSPPGRVYLAGPYAGAPFSLVVVVPTRAGPFDLGTVVTRAAIAIDPETAQARIRSDPLPRILDGIPIAYRTIIVVLDRPRFIRNPTSCEPMTIAGTAVSTLGQSSALSHPFQVGDCEVLGFRPRLSLRVRGSVRRGAHPSLRAVLRPRAGDANLRRVMLTQPRGALLDSRRIHGVCSRDGYARGVCPPSAAYGEAKAWSPLLHRPLSGPIYLRSSSGRLPDLVASLDGEFHLDLAAHLGSHRGRIQVGFGSIPDVPLSKVSIRLAGGKQGLLAMTGSLCRHRGVRVGMTGQNGRLRRESIRLRARCHSHPRDGRSPAPPGRPGPAAGQQRASSP